MSGSVLRSSLDWVVQPSAFVQLSYPLPKTASTFFPEYQHYGKGRADVLFVIGWAVLFWLAREVVMQGCLAPFMRRWLAHQDTRNRKPKPGHRESPSLSDGNGYSNGPEGYTNGFATGNGHEEKLKAGRQNLHSRHNANGTISPPPTPPNTRRLRREEKMREKKVVRFAEQGWSVVYYTVYWVFGLYIHCRSPYYPFNLDHLWKEYPHTPLPGPVKFYYLTQLAFWLNQLVVINIEARRKDHWQMMSHHVITTWLMISSYRWDVTRVGCLILNLIDFCDILLPFAKMTKYLDIPVLPDICFGVFLVSWLITRQGFFSAVVLSVIKDLPKWVPFKDDGIPGAVFTYNAWLTFSVLLSCLAVLQLLWLVMIARVAIKVVRGAPADDVRSDDEISDSEEMCPESPTHEAARQANRRRRKAT
ncbi:sphingosine N-acyltransferase lag1 [Tulasnella sp. JGI-2019a]|nr:sphingosine N-acyltransferase lag1 [Tulasnella sp. JGI-2019a]KAG9014232.1 sphingosine N-acyltransferase lag1 [Tulasnella sp. JGI-2019a]KAG9035953.1 sphingosine N-acyltransferase lag1 [Tulasnella sp. JGI-2019a]